MLAAGSTLVPGQHLPPGKKRAGLSLSCTYIHFRSRLHRWKELAGRWHLPLTLYPHLGSMPWAASTSKQGDVVDSQKVRAGRHLYVTSFCFLIFQWKKQAQSREMTCARAHMAALGFWLICKIKVLGYMTASPWDYLLQELAPFVPGRGTLRAAQGPLTLLATNQPDFPTRRSAKPLLHPYSRSYSVYYLHLVGISPFSLLPFSFSPHIHWCIYSQPPLCQALDTYTTNKTRMFWGSC